MDFLPLPPRIIRVQLRVPQVLLHNPEIAVRGFPQPQVNHQKTPQQLRLVLSLNRLHPWLFSLQQLPLLLPTSMAQLPHLRQAAHPLSTV